MVLGPERRHENHDQIHDDPDETHGCGRHGVLKQGAGVDPIPHQRKEQGGNQHIEDAAPCQRFFEGEGALFHDVFKEKASLGPGSDQGQKKT